MSRIKQAVFREALAAPLLEWDVALLKSMKACVCGRSLRLLKEGIWKKGGAAGPDGMVIRQAAAQ